MSQVLKDDKKTRHLCPVSSISYLKPELHLFNGTILADRRNDTQLTKDMKTIILALNEKYSDLVDLPFLLDSCFKTNYIKNEK